MDENLVSIIMPAYNAEKYISNSINSIIQQTYKNWELIIVDDCSTDKTTKVILNYKDERIYLLKNIKNSGAAISRNRALREAKGKWIAFLDSGQTIKTKTVHEELVKEFGKENVLQIDTYGRIITFFSDWKYNSEIIESGKTGIIVKAHDDVELMDAIELISKTPNYWNTMKKACILEATKYLPSNAMKKIIKLIET